MMQRPMPKPFWFSRRNGPAHCGRLALAACDDTLIPDAQSIAECAWPQVVAGAGVPAEQGQPFYVRHRVALTSAERAAGERL